MRGMRGMRKGKLLGRSFPLTLSRTFNRRICAQSLSLDINKLQVVRIYPPSSVAARQRLMRGDKSAQQNVTSPHKASAKPHLSKSPSVKPKNFPTEPRRKRKANQKFAPVMAGFCGEVLGVRGRLGGREGTLSRVPSLPPRSFSPRSLPQNQICSLTLEALPTLPRR